MPALREVDGGVIIPIKVVPGSSRTRIMGLWQDALKVNIAAPPEKGKANKELVNFLAKQLGCSRNDVSVVAGQTNPHKEVQVLGMTAAQLREALASLLEEV